VNQRLNSPFGDRLAIWRIPVGVAEMAQFRQINAVKLARPLPRTWFSGLQLPTPFLHAIASHSHEKGMRSFGRRMQIDSDPDRTIRVTQAGATPSVDSVDLFAGRREVAIRHGGELYRLRLTNSNKLILIK
jgi:hemin uptake protein HemP